jgi:hypothetical protein
MKRGAWLLIGAALWVGPATVAHGQDRDPADLLPAGTLAYLELRQPEQLSRELAGLVKGSCLENMPQTMARFRDEHPTNQLWVLQEVAMFSLFASPETIAEAGRLQGGALALTGFTKDNEPEIVGFLLAGQSHAPGFFLRAYLSIDTVRIVEEVEKIPLFRQHERDFRRPVAPGGPPQGEPEETGPTFALLPDAVVIGSTTSSVREVVQRYKSKARSPALSSVSDFKEAARLRGPGLFAYADCVGLTNAFDSFPKGRPLTDYEWSALKAFLNPKALRTVAASLVLRDGGLELRTEVALVPGQTSPFLQLLADRPVNLSLLHAAPKDSIVALTMSFPDGENAWKSILSMADTLAKLDGKPEDLWPSKAITELEKQLKISFGKDILGKIAGLALALNTRGEQPQEGMRLPLMVLQATSDSAAKDLEQAVPQIIALMSRAEAPAPTSEQVGGYEIHSLSGEGLPWGTALHYGRLDKILVFGQDRKAIVAALQGSQKKGGLLGEPKVAEAVRKFDKAVVLGVWSLPETIMRWMDLQAQQPAGKARLPGAPGAPPAPASSPPEENLDLKFARELKKAMEPLPAATVAGMRQPDRLTLEVRQPQLRSVSAKLIDIVAQWSLEDVFKKAGTGR